MAVLTPAVPVSTFTVLQQKVLVAQIATINAAIAAVTAAVVAMRGSDSQRIAEVQNVKVINTEVDPVHVVQDNPTK